MEFIWLILSNTYSKLFWAFIEKNYIVDIHTHIHTYAHTHTYTRSRKITRLQCWSSFPRISPLFPIFHYSNVIFKVLLENCFFFYLSPGTKWLSYFNCHSPSLWNTGERKMNKLLCFHFLTSLVQGRKSKTQATGKYHRDKTIHLGLILSMLFYFISQRLSSHGIIITGTKFFSNWAKIRTEWTSLELEQCDSEGSSITPLLKQCGHLNNFGFLGSRVRWIYIC